MRNRGVAWQIVDLLHLLEDRHLRAELFVTAYARTVDYHGLPALYNHWLVPAEKTVRTHSHAQLTCQRCKITLND